ncbi:ATP-dependent nuclease [Halobacillus campisalis]|uniref:ATP-dependent nuclease n=1 Tax=Halobacillus campisalis TaxID=435909 RepID=UPI0036F423D3
MKIANYRSISSMTVNYNSGTPLVICGPNNIGKTNFLRAIDLFFSLDKSKFNHNLDVPHHIAEGSAGGSKVHISLEFLSEECSKYVISTKYFRRAQSNVLELSGTKDGSTMTEAQIKEFMKRFKFVYIESNNIDLPNLISNYFTDEVLPGLDRLRRKQTEPLEHLNEFIKKSNSAVANIERGITQELHEFTSEVGEVNPHDWNVKVIFPEFDFLREAISNLVSYTLIDSNDRPLDTKGSGIQRLLLLALIKYVSKNSSEEVIWALDEPEVFLQPGLQKEVFKQLQDISENLNVFITTHSSHFIDLNDLNNTYLLDADHEVKEYARKPEKQFIKVNTKVTGYSDYEKVEKIKTHMGIGGNDGWHVTPFNLLVEGQIDKDYIIALSQWFDIDPPNILVAGGADKLPGYVVFLKEFCNDLQFSPEVNCLLDYDEKGKEVLRKLDRQQKKGSESLNLNLFYVIRSDDNRTFNNNFEIEDLIPIEIISDAANKILKNKKYSTIKAKDLDKRNSVAYKDLNVLNFLSEINVINNFDKPRIDFESISMKIYLSKYVCKSLKESEKFNHLKSNYSNVREFLLRLYSSKEISITR